MRILIPSTGWPGGTIEFCARAFSDFGHAVEILINMSPDEWTKQKWLTPYVRAIRPVDKWLTILHWREWNERVKAAAWKLKPDVIFVLNESSLYPDTLLYFHEKIGAVIVCWLADDPFDSVRFKSMPVLLKHFDHIFVGEPLWIPHVRMVAKPKTLTVLHGAADDNVFRAVERTPEETTLFGASISFTGNAYGGMAEGLYRGAILESVVDYGLKLWGYSGWERYFGYFPKLREAYQGRGTSLRETNIMNQVSDIVLNITHPQLFTAMQMRTFEIAASGGFQLADKKEEIDKLFPDGEIIQFSSTDDLRDKVEYYLLHEEERQDLARKAKARVMKEHTYRQRIKTLLDIVG